MLRRSFSMVAAILVAACGKPADGTKQGAASPEGAAGAAGVQQQAAKNAEEYDTGGTFEARISGAVMAAVRAKDASYCEKTSVTGAVPTQIFAMSLIEKNFSVLVNGNGKPLQLGKFPVTPASGRGFSASIVDKRAGQVVYASDGGDITIVRVDPDRVAGTYHILATQTGGGGKITADGSFEATRAQGCKN